MRTSVLSQTVLPCRAPVLETGKLRLLLPARPAGVTATLAFPSREGFSAGEREPMAGSRPAPAPLPLKR